MTQSPPLRVKEEAHRKLASAAAQGVRATVWGIVASSLLGGVKIVSGILGNSYALIADGIESLLDILSSLVVWGSLRIASQPSNSRFPYGYGKVEPLAALVVATALLAAAAGITIQSIREIRTPHHTPESFTLLILVMVVATKELMFRRLLKTGEAIGSKAMETDAWHHRSDSLTSIAAFIGISIALVGGPGYESADDWAALFAATVIAFNGTRLFRTAWREVLDVAPPAETIAAIRTAATQIDEVIEVETCRVRRSGLSLFIDLHVVVDGNLSVRKSHTVAHRVKNQIMKQIDGVQDVMVHIEPDDENSQGPATPTANLDK